MQEYANKVVNPTRRQQQLRQLLQRGWITEQNPYMRLLPSEQVLAVVMKEFTWVWWPGLPVQSHVDRDGQDCSPRHFKDLMNMRAINSFTRDMLHDEILHLKVFYTFLHVTGTMSGASTLDNGFCILARSGRAIPASCDELRMLADFCETDSEDDADSCDSDFLMQFIAG